MNGAARLLSRLRQHTRRPITFGGQVTVTMSANIALAGLGLVTGSLAARLLGPQGRGELAAIQTWAVFIALLAALGLPDAVVYFSGRSPKNSASYLASAVAAMLMSAIPFAVLGALLMPRLLSAQSAEVVTVAQRYLVIFLFLMATQGMLLHPLRGRNDFLVWNALRILPSLGWLVAIVVLSLSVGASPQAFAVAHLAALALAGLVTLPVLKRRVPGPYAVRPGSWRPMLRYGVPSALSALPQMLNLRLDQMLMATFLPPSLLGYYAVAVAWSSAVGPVLNSIGAVLFPRVASQQTTSDQIALLGRGTRLTVLLAALLTSGLLLITPWAIRLIFGVAFVPATLAAVVLVVAAGVAGLNQVLEEGLRGLGHTKAILWGESVGFAATAIGLALLLGPLQINGAAIASLVGYSATAAALLFWLHQRTGQTATFFVYPTTTDWRVLLQHLRKLPESTK